MNREEKQLEATLDAVIQRVSDIKTSISLLLVKLETEFESINWPTFLDNFALISGQMNSLLRILKQDKTFPMRNLAALPLLLKPDRDEDLVKLTENRISVFSHDVVPNYLRTKLDPDVEKRNLEFEQRASQFSSEVIQKQVNSLNKMANHVLQNINTAREEWENEAGLRAGANQTSSNTDTYALVAAVSLGKGLKQMPNMPGQVSGVRPNQPMANQAAGAGRPNQLIGVPGIMPQIGQQGGVGIGGKVPSTIKTNIKAASQMHPYGR